MAIAWERRNRAAMGMYETMRAMTPLVREEPRAAMMAIASIRGGKAIMVSINRWMMRSVLPPKWTLATPTTMPMLAPIKALSSPAYRETLAPRSEEHTSELQSRLHLVC